MSATGEGLFVLSAYEQAYLALADQLAEDGAGRADYATVFPVSLMSQAGSNYLPHFNTVDGDLVAPYVAAWVKYARSNGVAFSATNFEEAGKLVIGSTASSRMFAANAMLRVLRSGKLTGPAYVLIATPNQFTGDLGGDLRDAISGLGSAATALVKGASEGASATASFLKYAPWIGLGLGAAYIVWMSTPARGAIGRSR